MTETICKEIIACAKRLYARNLLAAADGNISYRVDDDHILMTPTGVSKADLQANEMAILKLNGEIVKGHPSSERSMHLTIYKHCPKARAVVHAHPPRAIAWTIAKPHLNALPNGAMSELILSAGNIPIAPYARPGTEKMGEVLQPYLPKHRIIILLRHGALTWGESLKEATLGMERLEHTCEILSYADALGGITHLSADEIQALQVLRETLGERIL